MSQNTSTSDTEWHDDITTAATQADYRELQAQFDQLQTELFNCRKKSASQAVQIETLAKEVDSANDRAGAIADERDRLLATLERIARYPANRSDELSIASARDIARAAIAAVKGGAA